MVFGNDKSFGTGLGCHGHASHKKSYTSRRVAKYLRGTLRVYLGHPPVLLKIF